MVTPHANDRDWPQWPTLLLSTLYVGQSTQYRVKWARSISSSPAWSPSRKTARVCSWPGRGDNREGLKIFDCITCMDPFCARVLVNRLVSLVDSLVKITRQVWEGTRPLEEATDIYIVFQFSKSKLSAFYKQTDCHEALCSPNPMQSDVSS